MDVKQSWVLLVSSGLALAIVGSSSVAQDGAAPKSRPTPLIYIPKTRVDLSRKKISRPAPGSRTEADQVQKGVIVQPERLTKAGSSDINYQRPAEQYAEHEAAAHQSFAVVPKPTPSDTSSNYLAASRNTALRAPFVADRGPLRPATAVGRPTIPTQPSMAFPTSSIVKDGRSINSNTGGATSLPGSNVEFVVPPVPASVPAAPAPSPSPITNEALDGAKPIAQAVKKSTDREPANNARSTIRVTHTITASPVATPSVALTTGSNVLPTANAPRSLTVATIADSKPAPIAQAPVSIEFTPTRQFVAHANEATSTPGTLGELSLVSFPDDDRRVATSTVPVAVPDLPAITPPSIPSASLPVVTPPQLTVSAPALPQASVRPVELPAVVRPASIPSPTEPAKLALPVIQQQVAASTVHPADVLLSELEREVAEMQAARDQLRSTVEATDMRAREVAARTNVAQAAQLQTLVTQVITKVRADQSSGGAAASDPTQRTRIVPAEDAPQDFITIGSRLYAKGMFEDSEVAFRTALEQAADNHDRAFASYLLATSLRRQSELTEAVRYYRNVAAQSDEPELRDLARWQLKNLTAKKTK